DPLVRPRLDPVVRGDLQVQPADLGRPHGVQGEALGVAVVDQLVGGGRDFGRDAQPGIGVVAVPDGEQAGRDRGPADAVEAVAAGDRVADDLTPLAAGGGVGQHRPVAVEVGDRGAAYLELQCPAVGEPPGDEVLD